jgi:hypothetical protein
MRTLLNDTLTGLLCSPEHAVASLRGVEGIAEHRIYYIFFFLLRKILKLSVMKHLLEPLCLRQLVIPLASPDFAHPASFQEDAFHSAQYLCLVPLPLQESMFLFHYTPHPCASSFLPQAGVYYDQ